MVALSDTSCGVECVHRLTLGCRTGPCRQTLKGVDLKPQGMIGQIGRVGHEVAFLGGMTTEIITR